MSLASDSRCRACQSPNRLELDRRLLAGDATRAVSAWLKSQGEDVSKTSLANHRVKHLAVVEKAREIIEKAAEKQVEEAVQKVVASVELLDEIAGMAITVARSMVEGGKRPDQSSDSMPSVVLFNGCLKEAREAVKTKHDIIHGRNSAEKTISDLATLLGIAHDDEGGEEQASDLVG